MASRCALWRRLPLPWRCACSSTRSFSSSAPSLALDKWDYQRHLSNDAFWEHKIGTRLESESSEKPARPDEEALTRQRESAFQFLLQTNRHEAAKLLVKVVIFIVVDALLFGSHWFIAQGAQSQ